MQNWISDAVHTDCRLDTPPKRNCPRRAGNGRLELSEGAVEFGTPSTARRSLELGGWFRDQRPGGGRGGPAEARAGATPMSGARQEQEGPEWDVEL